MSSRRRSAGVAFVLLVAGLAPLLLAMKPVRDARQRVLGYLDERPDGRVYVRDCQWRLLGWSDARATYDASGVRVYASAVPELLLSRSRCAAPTPTPTRGSRAR